MKRKRDQSKEIIEKKEKQQELKIKRKEKRHDHIKKEIPII